MNDLFCSAGLSTDCIPVLLLIQLLTGAFLAILFLQSGIDKITDRKGNLEWLTGHFAGSPFANMVPLLLSVITLMEVAAGALCAVGSVMLLFDGGSRVLLAGVLLSGVSLICLFTGQRLAKDYAGAAVLVNYFILVLLGLYFLSL